MRLSALRWFAAVVALLAAILGGQLARAGEPPADDGASGLDFPFPPFDESFAPGEVSTELAPAADASPRPAAVEQAKSVVRPVLRPVDEPARPASSGGDSLEGLDSRLSVLRDQVRRVLAHYHKSNLNSRDHNPWEMMHAIIGHGVDAEIHRDGPRGELVNATAWVCWNAPCKGERLLVTERGRVNARKGPDVQGHYGQFMAILAQTHVMPDYPLVVGNKQYTVADLVETEKLTCFPGMELTFKLIGLSHYYNSDEPWKNERGQVWSLERLVRDELAQPIRGAACGGTHRLMGLAYAVRKRAERGQPITGEYARAAEFLDDYHRYTLGLQNPDGSFSTEWFTRRGDRQDLDRRLQTSGHILEWLVYSLPEESLQDEKVVLAVEYLSGILANGTKVKWEVGPLGHGIHALALYDERVFQPYDGAPAAAQLARRRDAQVERSPSPIHALEPAANEGQGTEALDGPVADAPASGAVDESEEDAESDDAASEPDGGPELFFP